jgi:transposase
MGWTEVARREHDRSRLRYASDCTDREWAIIAPLLARTTKVGRPRLHRRRDLWNAIQYLAATGCQWAQLPKDFPPLTTVQYHFYRMRDSSPLDAINEVLVACVRVAEGHKAEPTAGIIDSGSVKTIEAGGPRGYDAGKEIKGRKCHIVTDTLGNMLEGMVHGAGVHNRDGAPALIDRIGETYPTLVKLFADGGYAGQKLKAAVAHIARLSINIIRRCDTGKFVALPRRWIGERTLARLNRCRRLAKDWEACIASSETWMVISSIRRMTRRIAKFELLVGL